MSNDSNKPVHRIRLSNISAAIFQNTNSEGRVFYNFAFDRSYKDGEEWKNTQNFGRDDLLLLRKVIDQSHSWTYEQQQQQQNNAPEP